jgi:hypothetical protein
MLERCVRSEIEIVIMILVIEMLMIVTLMTLIVMLMNSNHFIVEMKESDRKLLPLDVREVRQQPMCVCVCVRVINPQL